MVGHHSGLPHLYLRIEAVNLWQLPFEDSAPKGAKDNMREVCLSALCADNPFKVPKERVPAFDAKGYHIQAGATIVLPFSAPVLVVLNLMGCQSSAQQFFFRGRHYARLFV